MKSIYLYVFLFIVFCISILTAKKAIVDGEGMTLERLRKITWQTNINPEDIEFVKTNLNHSRYSKHVQRSAIDIIFIHDISSLKNDLLKIDSSKIFRGCLYNYSKNYLSSTDKVAFLKNLVNRQFDDKKWEKMNISIATFRAKRDGLYKIMLAKQIKYNKINKKYSEHIVKNILEEIENGVSEFDRNGYVKWHWHKKKAKKEKWPIADENGK